MESPLESLPVTDLALAQRLERAEGSANAAFVESRARSAPAIGAEWRDVGGTYAMFDGVGSPITQTFGFGLFSAPTHGQLDEIEAFFRERGSEVFQEVSPLAAPEVLTMLPERGYRPIELTSVMHMRLTGDRPAAQSRSSAELGHCPGRPPRWAGHDAGPRRRPVPVTRRPRPSRSRRHHRRGGLPGERTEVVVPTQDDRCDAVSPARSRLPSRQRRTRSARGPAAGAS